MTLTAEQTAVLTELRDRSQTVNQSFELKEFAKLIGMTEPQLRQVHASLVKAGLLFHTFGLCLNDQGREVAATL